MKDQSFLWNLVKEVKHDSGKEFKVIINSKGHIRYNGEIIAILAQWNKFEDLDPPTKRKMK